MTKNRRLPDLILIISLLLASVTACALLFFFRDDGRSVTVEIDGKTAATYSLSKNGEYSLNGGTNILVIEDGEAYIKEASCPDKTCVRSGRISHVGESAVCLPNRVSVTVTGESADSVDLVS